MILHLLKMVWNRRRANALLIAEIFISFIVLFAVLTAAITFAASWTRPLGYDWNGVWDVRMEFDMDARGDDPEDAALEPEVKRVMDEIRRFPQVEVVAASNTPPYAFSTSVETWTIQGREVSLSWEHVTDDFDDVMRVTVLRGRWFTAEDDASNDHPVVLDMNAARALFGDKDPIGQKIEGDERPLRVVGVVEELRKDGELGEPRNLVFRRVAMNAGYGAQQARITKAERGRPGSHLLVRLRPGTPAVFEETLVSRLEAVAPDMVFRVRHLDRMRLTSLRLRLAPVILGGVVALFLISMVALGMIGILWQSVTRRTREIGLRRAMGATGGNVHRQILGEVVLLALIALIIGVIVVLQLPLLGVFSVMTPWAFTIGLLAALATMLLLTVACGLYPSWLASRLTPADALRYE